MTVTAFRKIGSVVEGYRSEREVRQEEERLENAARDAHARSEMLERERIVAVWAPQIEHLGRECLSLRRKADCIIETPDRESLVFRLFGPSSRGKYNSEKDTSRAPLKTFPAWHLGTLFVDADFCPSVALDTKGRFWFGYLVNERRAFVVENYLSFGALKNMRPESVESLAIRAGPETVALLSRWIETPA